MAKKSITYIFFLFVHFAIAQSAKQDFEKINDLYNSSKTFELDFKYELYFNDNQKASDTELGFYKRNNDVFLLQQSGNEILINKSHVLLIDNENKKMILDKLNNNKKMINPYKLDLDSIFKFYDKVNSYLKGEYKVYVFDLKFGIYKQVEIVFNPTNYHLIEITNIYREEMPDENEKLGTAKLKMIFLKTNFKPGFNNSIFLLSTYIKDQKDKLITSDKYSKYTLLTKLKSL